VAGSLCNEYAVVMTLHHSNFKPDHAKVAPREGDYTG
jgi:hypothetical protein